SQVSRMLFEFLLPMICWSAMFILLDSYLLRRFVCALKRHSLDSVLKRVINVRTEYKHRSGKSVKEKLEENTNIHEKENLAQPGRPQERTEKKKDCVVLKNIVKRYGKKIVINNISVAVSQGECFCFLGREKSGKSTILNILTGHTCPTSGEILIGTQTIMAAVSAHIRIGYCPQTIALLDGLTGRDTLLLFGRLRGIPNTFLNAVTQNLIDEFRILNPDRTCTGYSFSNRKKLSIAASLIGAPHIVVLDEPTFDLDYLDKKIVWQFLSDVQNDHRTVVVATSSADECEIVCGKSSNMTILNDGKLACLSSPSVLMKNYGSGYTVTVRFRTDDDGKLISQMPFLNSAVEVFTDIEIISDKDVCRLHLLNNKLNLGKLFALLEDGISYYNVADYSVQKTSLAHILYSMSICPEEEYIEIPPGISSSFDVWPPQASNQRFESSVN
ncbi:unnamed protein product, partial [Candidula unifasciata]